MASDVLGTENSDSPTPIFISTPFIGQGDILNEEWIEGRIALFEAVTIDSLLFLLEDRVHWNIFLGRNPIPRVEKYAMDKFSNIKNIHIIRERYSSENITMVAQDKSEIDRYITLMIADDDAWPKDFISSIRKSSDKLLKDGYTHFGVTFANGLEWVMCDQVDIDFMNKSNFQIIRKKNLFEYRFPWLGCGFYIMQTKSRPFNFFTVAHPTIPQYLEKSGFDSVILEEPKRAWLYNRHQFADSSIVKSESQPLEYTHDQLEEEFGVNSKLLSEWSESPSSRFYFQKHAQGSGMLEMYEFDDISSFITMPYKYIYLKSDHFVIKPAKEFNIKGISRLRVYEEESKRYCLLLEFDAEEKSTIKLNSSLFNKSHNYKFDFQKWVNEKWIRVMPYVPLKFVEYENIGPESEDYNTIQFPIQRGSEDSSEYQLRLINSKNSRTFLYIDVPNDQAEYLVLNSSVMPNDLILKALLLKNKEGKWTVIKEVEKIE